MSRPETMPRQSIIAIPVTLATLFILAIIFYYLLDALLISLQVILVAATVGGVIFLAAAAVVGVAVAKSWWRRSDQKTIQVEQETTRLKLENDRLRVQIIVEGRNWHNAPAGSQVYLDDVLNQRTTPMHLQPGQINGHILPPTDLEIEHWRIHQLNHPTGSRPARIGGPEQQPALLAGQAQIIPDLLKALTIEQRICLEGPSGSGKSSLGRHIVSRKLDAVDQIIICDPQGSRPKWGEGIDAVGFGERYNEILDSFRRLEWVHKTRIEQIAQGHPERDFPIIFVVIEEVPDLVAHFKKQKVDIGYFLKMFLRKTRKTGIDIMLVTQVKTVKELDLEGNSKAMDAFAYVKTYGKDGRGHRVEYVNEFGEVYEYEAPPLWPDTLPVGVTKDKLALLPPAPTLEEIAIIDAIQANPGASYARIAEVVGISKSNHSNEKIRSVIARFGLERYEIGVK